MFKRILRKIRANPLDRMVKKAKKREQKNILLAWNRGLGDIPLGLFAIVHRIRHYIPDAAITFLTRENLEDGFKLLSDVDILVHPTWKRGKPYNVEASLLELQVDPASFDLIIDYPDPTYWVKWQRGKLTPKLRWCNEWEDLWKKFGLEQGKHYVGAHPHTETSYGLGRNWPTSSWQELFTTIGEKQKRKILLFGFEKEPLFQGDHIVDLRGKTTLFELLSIIKNCCRSLIVLDSGVSAMTYFLDTPFPLQLISLWGNPDMGILKQNVASPNQQLKHFPLLGEGADINKISVQEVEKALVSYAP